MMLFTASFVANAKTKSVWEIEKPTDLVLLITRMVRCQAVVSVLALFSFVIQSS